MAASVSLGLLFLINISYVNTINIDALLRTGYLGTNEKALFSPGQESNLKDSDIHAYLENLKGPNSDLNRPSSEFMIHLFKELVHGKRLAEAVGHTHRQTRNYISNSDTVRSVPSSKYVCYFLKSLSIK